MTTLLEGVKSRKWNSERFLLFQIVILQLTREVTRARDIKKRHIWRMDAWEKGKYKMLVQTTERDIQSYLSTKQKGQTEEQRAKVFNMKMIRGDV
jgi:L-asparaginase/Glu-tRNA(Gln) amidotransferase subunit D